MVIPKIIIQTWKTKKLPDQFVLWSSTWKKMNPDFTFLFFDDNDCFKFVFKNYPEYIDLYESLSNIEKADIFRYLALHKYGGVYADIDTACFKPIGPLLELFNKSVITGIEYENPQQYLQWFIACPKNSNLMIELVNEVNNRMWLRPFKSLTLSENELVYYTTGPVMFTSVLKNSSESVSVLEKGKLGCYDEKLIDKNSYIQHYFASSWKSKNVSNFKIKGVNC
jgi:mannosyltransferase OCH1-like enzyme